MRAGASSNAFGDDDAVHDTCVACDSGESWRRGRRGCRLLVSYLIYSNLNYTNLQAWLPTLPPHCWSLSLPSVDPMPRLLRRRTGGARRSRGGGCRGRRRERRGQGGGGEHGGGDGEGGGGGRCVGMSWRKAAKLDVVR